MSEEPLCLCQFTDVLTGLQFDKSTQSLTMSWPEQADQVFQASSEQFIEALPFQGQTVTVLALYGPSGLRLLRLDRPQAPKNTDAVIKDHLFSRWRTVLERLAQ